MEMQAEVVTIIILVPLVGGAGAFILSLSPWRLLPALFVLLSLLFGLVVAVVTTFEHGTGSDAYLVVGGWAEGVGVSLRHGGPSSTLVALFYLLSLLILVHALAQGERGAVFYGVYAISLGGMVGVALSADLFNLFVFFEVLSLSAALLIAYERSLASMQAAFRYLLVATLSIALYLLGLFILYRTYGELSFASLSRLMAGEDGDGSSARLAGALLFSAVATRIAMVPFCGWLPEAHGEAPTAVSALLSGLMLKAGFVAFWHIIAIFPGDDFLELMMWFGGISAFLGAGAALMQEDAKRLLAYSSISQLGYIAAAAGAGAFSASLYHLLSHAVYKSLLFLIVGSWVHQWGVRRIPALRQAVNGEQPEFNQRLSRWLLLFGVAALVGLPPLSAFASKGLMSALMKYSPVYPVIQATGVLTAAALIKLGMVAVPPRGKGRAHVAKVTGFAPPLESAGTGGRRSFLSVFGTAVPLLLLSLLTLFLGVFPGRLIAYLSQMRIAGSALLEQPEIYTASRIIEAVLVVAAGLLLAKLLGSSWGRKLSQAIRRARVGVDGSMAFVVIGTVIVAAALLL